jgi:hypothetical protein
MRLISRRAVALPLNPVKLSGISAAALVCALLLSAPAAAQQPFIAYLYGFNQDPPNESTAEGVAIVTVDTELHTIRMQVEFENLSGPATGAGIHGITATPGDGAGMCATVLPAFPSFPVGETSGSFDYTFAFEDLGAFNPAFVAAHGGPGSAPSELINAIGAGKAYVNLPSAAYPDGEMRGFLLATQAADFNLDGLVGSADLGTWASEQGFSNVADANRDLLADGTDFLIWQRQLGLQAILGGGLGHHATPVPEPPLAAELAVVSAAMAGSWRRRRGELSSVLIRRAA